MKQKELWKTKPTTLRRGLSLLLALALLLTLLPQAAVIARADSYSGNCGLYADDNLTWIFDPDTGTLTIEGSGRMHYYSWDNPAPWNAFCEEILYISLPDGITYLNSYAFYNCSKISSIVIPDSVTALGQNVFYNCSGLTSVTFSKNLTDIYSSAFSGCSNLSSVSFSEGLNNIENGAFSSCTSLISVNLPNTLTHLGRFAFSDCSSLPAIILPDSISEIDEYTFNNCTSLSSVSFPASLKKLGELAFYNCTNLTSLTFPDGLEEIGERAFENCTNLLSVSFPEGLKKIEYCAFSNCTSLISVSFPSSLTVLGIRAFESCESLSFVVFQGDLEEISEGTFSECKELSSIIFPTSLKRIGGSAFSYCYKLSSVEFPEGLEEIGNNAFARCDSLSSLILPESLKYIGDWAFSNCDRLQMVTLPGGVEKLGKPVFDDCDFLRTLVVRNTNCLVLSYLREEFQSYEDNNDSMEDEKGEWYVEYENTYTNALGYRKVSIYGNHDANLESAPMVMETEENENFRYVYGYRYIENCAKTYGHHFYATNVFDDVKQGKFYEIPVAWAYGEGITSGKDATHFAPNETCTRGQVVTFLWNAMGKPAPTITDCPFVDVKPGKYYYDAMLWALETGVTSGKDDTHFAPNETCTRGQVVTFIWNAMGKPEPTITDCPFVDTKPGKYYYNAMLWALENGVTSGTDATHFSPNQTCTRGQVVTFLYNTLS